MSDALSGATCYTMGLQESFWDKYRAMTIRRPLIAGNWKMNGLRRDAIARVTDLAARAGADDPGCDVAICPPASLLHALAEALNQMKGEGSAITLGGQDCHAAESGAHTGDISAAMLADAGCAYAIVGHSERRADHGENDPLVRAKAEAAHGAGLIAIVCLGESEALFFLPAVLLGFAAAGVGLAAAADSFAAGWEVFFNGSSTTVRYDGSISYQLMSSGASNSTSARQFMLTVLTRPVRPMNRRSSATSSATMTKRSVSSCLSFSAASMDISTRVELMSCLWRRSM